MTLDEAIKHCEEVAEPKCDQCGKEHRQLAEWLKELKALKERPQGEWEAIGFVHGYAFCICSNCHKTMRLYRDSKNEFCCIADIRKNVVACMYCGADMRGKKNNS